MPSAFCWVLPPSGTLLANQVGPRVLNASGWRNCFSVCAICIWVVAALVLVVIKEPKREAAPAVAKKASMLDGVKNYFTNPQILILSLAWLPVHGGASGILHLGQSSS